MVGVVVFGLASLAAVWVDTPTALIATRLVAGAGAALIMPTTLSLITAGVPREQRAMGVSVWAAVAGVGGAQGVHHAITLLRDEVDRNMAMLGANSMAEITRDCLRSTPR